MQNRDRLSAKKEASQKKLASLNLKRYGVKKQNLS